MFISIIHLIFLLFRNNILKNSEIKMAANFFLNNSKTCHEIFGDFLDEDNIEHTYIFPKS